MCLSACLPSQPALSACLLLSPHVYKHVVGFMCVSRQSDVVLLSMCMEPRRHEGHHQDAFGFASHPRLLTDLRHHDCIRLFIPCRTVASCGLGWACVVTSHHMRRVWLACVCLCRRQAFPWLAPWLTSYSEALLWHGISSKCRWGIGRGGWQVGMSWGGVTQPVVH